MPSGADHKTYDYLRESCLQVIAKVEQLIATYDQMLQPDSIELSNTIKALATAPFEQARSEINTGLINIAVCGSFSSGKSFLVSALIDNVTWYPQDKPEEVLDPKVDRYVTLLPTSPQQTNSCPLAIVPYPSGKRLQVMFDDIKEWEDKSAPDTSDEEISRRILAYATDIEEGRSARLPEDQTRSVLKARLLIGPVSLPAVIYDLPGIGGIGETYLQQVHEALREADVIVYVASAIKELTDAEFELLRFVEEIAEQDNTPIVFALAQTDREPDWGTILEKDNQFLRDLFTLNGAPREELIGKGFVPISVAAEAKARGLFASGKLDEAERDRAIEQSGMPAFRQMLDEQLTTRSGPTHLRKLIMEMHGILKDVRAHMENRMQTKTLPLQDAEKMLQERRALVRALSEKAKALPDDLDKLIRVTIAAALATSNPEDLHRMLKEQVVPIINKVDVTKDAEKDKIQQSIKKVRDEWLARPEAGFTARWAKANDSFRLQSMELVRKLLDEASNEAEVTYPVNVGEQPMPEESVIELAHNMQAVRMAQRISVGVTGLGVGGVAASAIALGGITMGVGPVGLFLIWAGAAGVGLSTLKQRADMAKLRSQLTDYLPKYSNLVIEQLEGQAKEQLAKQKAGVLAVVDQMIAVQKDNVIGLESRIETGDLKVNREQVALLKDMLGSCRVAERLILNPKNWSQF